jgi:hypothetical protein
MRLITCAACTVAISSVLTGCATAPITTVKVPVPVQCQEAIPDRPVMPTEAFTTKPKLDEFARAAMAELERREGYEGRLRTALEACTAPIGKATP